MRRKLISEPLITIEKIVKSITNEWQPITAIIFKLGIKETMDAGLLLLKFKELEKKGVLISEIKNNKRHWKRTDSVQTGSLFNHY